MARDINKPTQATPTKNICLRLNPPKRLPLRRTLVVLGVERGGTSMAAGVLRALGVPMGDKAGLNHEDPLFLREGEDRLDRAIRTRNKEHDVWGFKVPKASLMLPFLESRLRNPFYVVVYRNPLSIVDSWLQRGAGQAQDVLNRINTYQQAIAEMTATTRAPVLFVNYERAVADDAAKQQVVEEFADFAGIGLTGDLRARAMSMMTGDGKGYVNLPEHFFLVQPGNFRGDRPALDLAEIEPGHRDAGGWVLNEKPRPKIIYGLADGGNLPRRFWLELDVQAEDLDFTAQPVRVHFNFTGAYFPGHCARPEIAPGRNLYWVETSGNASDMGFGVVNVPARLNIRARAYSALDSDQPATVNAASAAPEIGQKAGLVSRVVTRVLQDGE
ncbi:hypothetical protein [Marimonas lutisalis]|uniref:hypothetical protein n=1 Tax=Marimonas lutisalis TaxID=2545756 RepID=UPI0010F6F32C|nr:hypothetical protein [Marimonas lutisalis]